MITTWVTYACFYLCRVNISIAMPGIMGEFGITKTERGMVLTALLSAYAIGQFINGQLGDRFGARKIIALGVLGSVAMNLIFGFNTGVLISMILIWGLNGYFQSMGWSLSVKTVANWFPSKMRGKISGILGTSYQIGNAASWVLAGFVIGLFGWRYGFWVPSLIFLLVGVFWYIRSRNAPEEVGLPTIEEEENGIAVASVKKDKHLGFKYTISQTLFNPRVWVVGLGLLFLNIVRYGFLSWAPTYLFEVQKATISAAAYNTVAIPIAGSLGAIFAGYLSDKFFKSRRAPIAVLMLLTLSLFSWIYPQIPSGDWMSSLIVLVIIGFMTYGPHVLMVTAMPMDYGTRKAAASATGFIDGLGYVGAAITGVGSGWLIDNFGWNAAFNFWVVSGVICAILMALLWNYRPSRRKYM